MTVHSLNVFHPIPYTKNSFLIVSQRNHQGSNKTKVAPPNADMFLMERSLQTTSPNTTEKYIEGDISEFYRILQQVLHLMLLIV